jgi:DNA-binding beta-propeller fold protein YncE
MNGVHSSMTALCVALFCGILMLSWPATACAGMGMDFGGSGAGSDATCVVDVNPVISKGAYASPLRLVRYSASTFLVADYVGRALFRYVSDGTISRVLEVDGQPLSVAVRPAIERVKRARRRTSVARRSLLKAYKVGSESVVISSSRSHDRVRARKREPLYLLGNDSTRTIDLYVEREGSLRLARRLFTKEPVQALDMVYDEVHGLVFFVDGLSRSIKAFDPNHPRRVQILSGDNQLSDPKGIAVDGSSGELFVTDYGDLAAGIDPSVKVFDLSGSLLRTLTGAFGRPQGLTVSSEAIYLVDAVQSQVIALDRQTGSQLATYGCMGSSEGHLLLPMDVELDASEQSLLVADNRNMRITVLPLETTP